ncbi:hypothetical protein [uncultured Draconibacterium sp.]|uniref:hypothetical protein n=1 Tax=uncultured Draconibacterium sp. TaxID=1573823 RepID=UPI00326109D2
MKKIIILPFLFLTLLSWGQAQFVVQNGAKTEVYNNINTAITNAAAGDTLYLPGGGFSITNTTIDKTLHWVGHGHNPQETSATKQTRIVSSLTFTGNCDGSSFEGILFTSTLNFGSDGDDCVNVKLKRCRLMNALTMRYDNNGDPVDLNFHITECVLQGIVNAFNGSNCTIEHSLLFSYVLYFEGSLFNHNDFPALSGCSNCSSRDRIIQYSNNCLFTNNVFSYQFGLYNSNSCELNYNLFDRALPFDTLLSTHSGSNNIVSVPIADIYTSIENDAYNTFSYNNDYHLNATGTGTAQDGTPGVSIKGAASDGTDMGVYGTSNPYKTIPYYPHINTATIASEAVSDQLGVTINAEAQSR